MLKQPLDDLVEYILFQNCFKLFTFTLNLNHIRLHGK